MDCLITENAYYGPYKKLWKALHLPCEIKPADCIVGFGNYNTDIPKRAAELYFAGFAPVVLFTGGLGRNTEGRQAVAEADLFANVALAEGVPEDAILIENRSRNTKENIEFTRQLLEEHDIHAKSLLGVHQPFMEKRIAAAFPVYWPEVQFSVTSPQVDIPTFFVHAAELGISGRTVIEETVGDFQRMKLYAEMGWQKPVEFSDDVLEAYNALVRMGYTGQLAK